MKYFTFDRFYNVPEFNTILRHARDNGINFKVFIDLRSPFKWVVAANDYPVWLRYDKIEGRQSTKYLCNVLTPRNSNERYRFLRKTGIGKEQLKNYLVQRPVLEGLEYSYTYAFKVRTLEDLKYLSLKYKNVRFYKLGRSNLFPFIIGYCYSNDRLKDLESKSFWVKGPRDTYNPLELELSINIDAFIYREKLINKYFDCSSYLNGNYKPLLKGQDLANIK